MPNTGAPASEKKTRGRFFFKAISAGLTNLPNQESRDWGFQICYCDFGSGGFLFLFEIYMQQVNYMY